MKASVLATAALTTVLLATSPAVAETILASAPLQAGEGGAVCSCANLTKENMAVTIWLQRETQQNGCFRVLEADGVEKCSIGSGVAGDINACRVWREDGKGITPKHAACVLQALDASGNPTAVVPLQKKKR